MSNPTTRIPDFRRVNEREDRSWIVIGLLALAVLIQTAVIGIGVGTVRSTDTTAKDVRCIAELDADLSQGIADGLVAITHDDDQALETAVADVALARQQLALINTPNDPCHGG